MALTLQIFFYFRKLSHDNSLFTGDTRKGDRVVKKTRYQCSGGGTILRIERKDFG